LTLQIKNTAKFNVKVSGISFEPSPPYSQHKNGVSERLIGVITEKARAMMIDSQAPLEFWGEAVMTAAYLLYIDAHPAGHWEVKHLGKCCTLTSKGRMATPSLWGHRQSITFVASGVSLTNAYRKNSVRIKSLGIAQSMQ
jgi:hypothetical protein